MYKLTLLVLLCLLAACTIQPTAPAPTDAPPVTAATETPVPLPGPAAELPTPAQPVTEELALLQSNSWQWVSFTSPVEQYAIDNPQSYTVTFNADGTMAIHADCNNAGGSYTINGNSITIQVGPMITAACPPESLSGKFFQYLGFSALYFFKDGHLFIDLFADGGTLEFAPLENVVTTTLESSAANEQSDLNAILGNLSYSGVFEDRLIALTDGLAHYGDGGSQLPYVAMVNHRIPTGDLNGDGAQDAVVLLVDKTTGSGDFVYLAPVLDVWTKPKPLQAFMIGDRIPVKSLDIRGGKVIAELIAPGAGDPACCPSWNVRKLYSLENDRLVERSRQELGKVSLDDLNGTSWQLVDLDQGREPLLPETKITLGFQDGQARGSAGCNNYASFVSGDANLPQTLVVGPIATTKILCPDPILNQETTFLSRLESVIAWRYDFGYLSLVYKIADNVFSELLFTPQDR